MHKQFVVRLSDEERGGCQEILKPLKGSSQQFRRAQMLLTTDADGPAWSDVRTAAACNCRAHTLEHLRNRVVTEGVAWALEGKQRQEPPTPCTLDGEADAQWSALRLGKPPSGDGHWTLHLLADDAHLLDTRYAACEDVTLVCANLNTHPKGAFYEAFEPARARAYIKRIHCCYTPKPGSGLQVAACALRGLTSQCLRDRRIGAWTELQSAIAAWSNKTHAKQRGVDWQCRIENARVKRKRLYPKIKA